MGVWGTAIFSDDLASDIREDYTDAVGEGLSGADATRQILRRYGSSIEDPDDCCVVWLALAATQWKLGRLESDVLQKALGVIDSGSDLKRWDEGTPDFAKRRKVLEKLRQEITSPQTRERKVVKRRLCESPWKEGDVFSYTLLSGRKILFRVIKNDTDKGGTYPVCKLLDWIGDEIPSKGYLKHLGAMKSRADRKHAIYKLMLVGLGSKWAKRIQTPDLNLMPLHDRLVNKIVGSIRVEREPTTVVHFKYLDRSLKDWFLLE